MDEIIKMQNCDGSTGGVIYVTATYGELSWEFHVWESVVSSSWLYLLINNPAVLFPRTLTGEMAMKENRDLQQQAMIIPQFRVALQLSRGMDADDFADVSRVLVYKDRVEVER